MYYRTAKGLEVGYCHGSEITSSSVNVKVEPQAPNETETKS